jgi:hypothetical protein
MTTAGVGAATLETVTATATAIAEDAEAATNVKKQNQKFLQMMF